MLFNSLDFALFLPVVFVLYWFLFKGLKAQNMLLLVASYVFYGWWDPRFLLLILFSSIIDFAVGLGMARTEVILRRKALLALSITVNLGMLGIFKYYDFFITEFASLLSGMGLKAHYSTLNIILPVGISFYTFQTLSYSIDVYRKVIKPTRDPIAFFAFVSFFPQLVAGPIERAKHLIPQFTAPRVFNNARARDGLRQILWGLFKKVVIADNAAWLVDHIYANPEAFPGTLQLLASVFFAFQIYGDFSGYSDIAIGSARLFGFDLMRNFAYPYFSRDIAEFWRRWHISLSTWFRDYLYIPLGGSRGGTASKIRNTIIIFIVSGFWHGANWTFIVWGALNALYFIPLLLAKKNRQNLEVVAFDKKWPNFREVLGMALTFSITVLAWTFFRAESLQKAFDMDINILTDIWSGAAYIRAGRFLLQHYELWFTMAFIVLMLAIEWRNRREQHGLQIASGPMYWRWSSYLALIFMILLFGDNGNNEFIYFQF